MRTFVRFTIQKTRAPELLSFDGMAKPDRPNFSLPARIIFGVIALIVIVALLAVFGYLR